LLPHFAAIRSPSFGKWINGYFAIRDAHDITHDLNNYLDLLQHSPVVDLKVLSGLAAGGHAVSREAPLASIRRLQSQLEAYRQKPER